MPLIVENNLPAKDILEKENIFIMEKDRAKTQDIRPVRLAIVNLMPNKEETELQILRALSNTPLQVNIDLVRTETYKSKNTEEKYLERFYKDFSDIKNDKYDGMIITGAPVELMDYEEVSYWNEITEIFDWARTHVTSTFYICWAAQAGLYHHYGIPKYPLEKKKFGVYEHLALDPLHPIFRGFDDVFYVPHSRHTEVRKEDILNVPQLKLLSESEGAGVYMVEGREGREFFVTGHSEYSPFTLDVEYRRDKEKGLPIELPQNYYRDNDPTKEPLVRWRGHANLLFSNWLNYFVYQETPYNIEDIK